MTGPRPGCRSTRLDRFHTIARPRARVYARVGLITLAALACARAPAAPAPNQIRRPPDLTGKTVLVLPVHAGPVPSSSTPAAGRFDDGSALDSEIGYWLAARAPTVKWILPPTIDRTLARSPGVDIKPRALDVSAFRRAEVRRIGDPLFGDLRRLAAILDAGVALLPVAAEYRQDSAGQIRLEVALALIDTNFGDVLWFGILAGDPGSPGGQAMIASAAERVAATFGPTK